MREVRLWFSRGILLILAVFFSSASVWSSGKESHMPPLMNSNSHTVNLEVTHLFHALKWVEWKEEDLPPVKKPVKCMIVGKDILASAIDFLSSLPSPGQHSRSAH